MAKKRKKRRLRMQPRFFLFIVILLAIVIGVLLVVKKLTGDDNEELLAETPVPTMTVAPTATPKPALPSDVTVTRADSANPSTFGVTYEIKADGDDVSKYSRPSAISFGRDVEYASLNGILTFGGNNYRNSFSYGVVSVTEKRLREMWSKGVNAIGSWSGTGWTGQPLIVEWPVEIVAIMNVDQTYKDAGAPLVEVIYPAMDGNIYFYDINTGTPSRTQIAAGVVQKGTACVDPRGYPILYVGQGIPVENDKGNNAAFVRAYSLITGEEIGSFGGFDWFGRRSWQAYDSSPMIAGDTLVYGGENGVLYTVKLNASFDQAAGTVSINPEGTIKMRYEGSGYSRSDAAGARWYGIESSVAAFRNYLYFTDNGGRLLCVDVNTMAVKFVVDVTDESDSTIVIEESYDDNTIYLYTGSQVKADNGGLGAGYGYSYQRKINGLTGAIVWEKKQICSTGDANSSGGCLATPHVGRGTISNLVIYSLSTAAQTGGAVSETPAPETTDAQTDAVSEAVQPTGGAYQTGGLIVAYDKTTGEVAWQLWQTNDYWASPAVAYDEQGKAYLIQCDRGGIVSLYDASLGTLLNTLDLGSRIDSTPAIFNNLLVVGTRGKGGAGQAAKISCVKIS